MLGFHPNLRPYRIDAYLGDAYASLGQRAKQRRQHGQPAKYQTFLLELDAKLPQTASAGDQPTRADVVRVYRQVEEADKIHFVRLIPHDRNGKRHVSDLDKTRRLMGQATRDWCERNDVSTSWTDIPPRTPAPEALPTWPGYR